MCRFILVAKLLTLLAGLAFSNDIEDKQLSYLVHHTFDSSGSGYVARGSISVPLTRSTESLFEQLPLSAYDAAQLRKLAEQNGLYRVTVFDSTYNRSVSSFAKACSLYESELRDQLTLTLDRSGALIGVSDFIGQQCVGTHVPEHRLVNFNTTLSVSIVNIAPGPDTQTYIRRLEQEKAERARGEHADNRSFFAKYWMYIMPLLIFLLISGASNPEGQGGGNSGR